MTNIQRFFKRKRIFPMNWNTPYSVEEICLQVLGDASVPSQVKREDASPSLQRRPNLRQCLFVQGGVTEVHMKEVLVILDESS